MTACLVLILATKSWDVAGSAGLMGGTDELGGFQFLELRSTLPDELLMYADKLFYGARSRS